MGKALLGIAFVVIILLLAYCFYVCICSFLNGEEYDLEDTTYDEEQEKH